METKEVKIPVAWNDPNPPDPERATQILVQREPSDEVLLTFGKINLPLIAGSPEDQIGQATRVAESGGVSVKVVARVALTLKTAMQLHAILGGQLGLGKGVPTP